MDAIVFRAGIGNVRLYKPIGLVGEADGEYGILRRHHRAAGIHFEGRVGENLGAAAELRQPVDQHAGVEIGGFRGAGPANDIADIGLKVQVRRAGAADHLFGGDDHIGVLMANARRVAGVLAGVVILECFYQGIGIDDDNHVNDTVAGFKFLFRHRVTSQYFFAVIEN